MRKFLFFVSFLVLSAEVFAVPARLGGFSYSKDEYGRVKLSEETEAFNEGPPALMEEEEPLFPFYLNEDLSDARTGVTPHGDRYQLIPIYSTQQLYDMKNGIVEEGEIEEDVEDEEEEFEEE